MSPGLTVRAKKLTREDEAHILPLQASPGWSLTQDLLQEQAHPLKMSSFPSPTAGGFFGPVASAGSIYWGAKLLTTASPDTASKGQAEPGHSASSTLQG